jgi:hypothetical protein
MPARLFIRHHKSVTEYNASAGEPCDVGLVSDDNDSNTLAVEVSKDLHHFHAGYAIQIAGWFVG